MTHEDISETKPKILIVCNYYLPGYKAGGGLRTIVHTVERFKDRFDFRIITFGCDSDNVPYNSVKIDEWNQAAGAQVFYLSKKNIKLSKLRELVSEVKPNLIYINSVFSKLSIYLLILKRLKLIPEMPTIIAPEGELSDGALQLKAFKKKVFIGAAKRTGLYKNLIWKVTAEPEKLEAERFEENGGEIFIAPNMPSKSIYEEYEQKSKPRKEAGAARMIFLSRYARKKNFKWLADNLTEIVGNLEVDIYGPIEDEAYWNETQTAIKKLPSNVRVTYRGQIIHEKVLPTIFDYHFFVLPTLGENFGHVFVEALAAGCPLVISDTTPWTNLSEKKIGWDLSLKHPGAWTEIINHCIGLDDLTYRELSGNSRRFACDWLTDPQIEASTLNVLLYGLSKTLTDSR